MATSPLGVLLLVSVKNDVEICTFQTQKLQKITGSIMLWDWFFTHHPRQHAQTYRSVLTRPYIWCRCDVEPRPVSLHYKAKQNSVALQSICLNRRSEKFNLTCACLMFTLYDDLHIRSMNQACVPLQDHPLSTLPCSSAPATEPVGHLLSAHESRSGGVHGGLWKRDRLNPTPPFMQASAFISNQASLAWEGSR